MTMDVILQQVLIIFGYVLVGWIASKTGILNGTVNKSISDVIVKITLPLSIVASAEVEATNQDLVNIALTGVILILSYIIGALIIAWYAKAKQLPRAKHAAYSGLAIFPNVGFIGIPLCAALMGDRAMLYAVGSMAAFNFFFFTYQYLLFCPGEKIRLKVFASPVNISMFILIGLIVMGWHLPSVAQTITYNVGAMTTPLALMVVGTMLSEGDLLSVLKSKAAYVMSIIRNFALPLVLIAVLIPLPLEYEMKIAITIFASCPCANLTAVFAAKNGMETELCARTILLSTLMFMVSLPFLLWLAQLVFA